VLYRYKTELETNKQLYEAGKVSLCVSKNKPRVAGSIFWARSIFFRIKRPIMKFITKESTLDPDLFKSIKQDYKNLAKVIDVYQKEKFENWKKSIIETAMEFLKQEILKRKGENQYGVNFSDDFKILIKEVKHLEKMGYPIPKTIINISLQEKEYYSYIDRLYLMLDEYNEAVHGLSDIDKKLLQKQINDLNAVLEPGHESLNLSSLGVPDFIDNCMKAINHFRDVVKKV